jgi:hypothetical protein
LLKNFLGWPCYLISLHGLLSSLHTSWVRWQAKKVQKNIFYPHLGAPGTTKYENQGNRLSKLNNRRRRKLFCPLIFG